jgi:PAS domain S-box-containing protein
MSVPDGKEYKTELYHLPRFAEFIINNHLDEYVSNQVRLIKEKRVPLFKFYSHLSEAEYYDLSYTSSKAFLLAIMLTTSKEALTKKLLDQRMANMHEIGKERTEIEDIFLVANVRRKNFRMLLSFYTNDIDLREKLLDELDEFLLEFDKITTATYLQQLQEKVEEEIYFRARLTDTSPGFYYIYDRLNDRQIYQTKKLFIYLGYDTTEYEGNDKFFRTLIHADDLEAADQYVQKLSAAKDGEVHYFEYRLKNKEGNYTWIRNYESVYKRNVDGEPVHIMGVAYDISRERKALEALIKSQELYKQAQSLNKLGNWSWQINSGTLKWSDELYRIYGMEPQEEPVNFEKFISFVHPEDRKARLHDLEEQLKNYELKEYYFKIIARDGKEKILYGQSQVFADSAGNPMEMVGTCQDVTRQKELENSLYTKTLQLEQSNASLEEFAYISSHDLKEPIRKISLFTDKLRDALEPKLEAEDKYTLDKIISSANRMKRMVDEILSLSRISAENNYSRCSLQKIIQEVVISLEQAIIESNASIIFSDLPDIWVNENRFHQLFFNLISNAIKFRHADRSPVIEISYKDLNASAKHLLPLEKNKRYGAITVRDNGIGFSSEYAQKIFTIFQRLHTRDAYEGTGIGLAICKKIAEQHQGLIYAEGITGEGAVFTVVIPAL